MIELNLLKAFVSQIPDTSVWNQASFVRQELRVVSLYWNEHLRQTKEEFDPRIDSKSPPKWAVDPKSVRALSQMIYEGKGEKDFVSAWMRPWRFVSSQSVRKAASWAAVRDQDFILLIVTEDPTIRYGVDKAGMVSKLTKGEYVKLCPKL